MAQYLMLKDTPVLKINDNYACEILDFAHLPHALRYQDVNYDDVMHGWTEVRTMSIRRTNGKRTLEALGIRQRNPYVIAKACHFASLSDCYWLNEELKSQTSEKEETLLEAAVNSFEDAEINLKNLYENLNQVGDLNSDEKLGVDIRIHNIFTFL